MNLQHTRDLYLFTGRLRLRPLEISDATFAFKLRSDKDTMQFIERPLMNDVSEASLLCANIIDLCQENSAWFWVIELGESGKVIGTITLWNYQRDNHRAEVGFMLDKEYTQHGYMKESGSAVVDFAFNTIGLHSIEAHTRPENIASSKTLETIGFAKDGCLRENVYFNERYWNTLIYSVLSNKHK